MGRRKRSLTIRWGEFDPQPPLPSIVESPRDAAPSTPAATADDATPQMHATDPRWVLAVRTSQLMQGDMIRPGDRERLIRTGRVLGLNGFESNLVIAIMQDQARRGLGLDTAAPALSFVPIHSRTQRADQRRWMWRVAIWSAAAVGLELLILIWMM
ncbi:hypothetical protein HED60_19080 [Planctomycetales bacterium ZRK34]|nr:hypothetical protein HED60_19080 [Planctomycetales bacterium ZRK34]